MRIVVSGGGTAGHISPTLATCDALKSLDSNLELLYVGQEGGMEARIVDARGINFRGISAGKFRRYHSAGVISKALNLSTLGPNARDAGRVVAGFKDSFSILRQYKPDVVFLSGGFVCLPVGLAAKVLRIPFVIHESDVSPGLTNRILGKWASKIAVGFPVRSYHDFDKARLVYTGNPVRQEIANAHRLEGLAKFDLYDRLPVLLVTGGSGGAREINDVVVAALPQLVSFCQVLHLTGEREQERVKFEVSRLGEFEHKDRYQMFGFLMAEMALALAAADVVIGRAGANNIAELAALGKPTILIPNNEMAGHQVDNARVLSRAGAARVLDGDKVTKERLVGEVRKLATDREEQERLSRGIKQFGQPEAATDTAKVILEVGGAGERGESPQSEESRGE